MRTTAIVVAAFFAAPAVAQNPVGSHRIDVTGHGKVSLPPDTANIHYWLRGEGKTPDEATRAMVEAQNRVESGLKGFFGADATITTSNLVVVEARDPACKTQYGQAALSQGDCAIIGYIASSEAEVRTGAVGKVATAVGLAGRLGARDSRLQSYELRDTDNARRDAMNRAVADARSQAEILARAAGGHRGRVITIQYGAYGYTPVVLTGSRVNAPPPPPPPPAPVQIDAKPRPQEVSADVSVSYELLR
jgi:uncharacterized protein YggE